MKNPMQTMPQLIGKGVEVDFAKKEVRFSDGQKAILSEKEGQLLCYLAQNAGRVVSRDEILMQVWRLNPHRILTRVIDMHVVHLREKLHDRRTDLLRTVYGEGYQLAVQPH